MIEARRNGPVYGLPSKHIEKRSIYSLYNSKFLHYSAFMPVSLYLCRDPKLAMSNLAADFTPTNLYV